jgi:hypothetical protein
MYKYDTINLPNSGVLRIQAPTTIYVVGPTILNNASEIFIEGDGALHLYLGGNLEDKNSTGFTNDTFDATRLKIYGLDTCLHIDLKAKSDFYGAVYAPEADIDLYNGGDFYGSIAATSFEMKNSGNFYYDRRLSEVDINDAAAVFKVVRWWEG